MTLDLHTLQASAAEDLARLRAEAARCRAQETTPQIVLLDKPCLRCKGRGDYARGVCYRCGGHGNETKTVDRPMTDAERAAAEEAARGFEAAAERTAARMARRAARIADAAR